MGHRRLDRFSLSGKRLKIQRKGTLRRIYIALCCCDMARYTGPKHEIKGAFLFFTTTTGVEALNRATLFLTESNTYINIGGSFWRTQCILTLRCGFVRIAKGIRVSASKLCWDSRFTRGGEAGVAHASDHGPQVLRKIKCCKQT